MNLIQDWMYRWRRSRALLRLGNAWYYMFKKGLFHRDADDAEAADILERLFWDMYEK